MSKPQDDPKLKLPEALRDGLENYSNQRVFVPPAVDAKVLDRAHDHLRTYARQRPVWPWWAAAAALVVTLVIWSSLFNQHQLRRNLLNPAAIAANSGDVDGNG